jgi:energy-coupling factor transport system ATP-binding protein
MNKNSFIQLCDISYKIKEKILFEEVSFNLNLGECVVLVGKNGSGKTTLSKIIMGILKPAFGTVKLLDKDIRDYSLAERGREIGYCFQNPEKQIFNPTVKEELLFYYRFTKQKEKDYTEITKFFNIDHLLESKTLTLSQGEKQRLALAIILMLEPKFLILDEPSTGLDYNNRAQLYSIINRLKVEKNIGSLIISHDKALINSCADYIYRIKDRGIEIERQV